MNTRSQAATTLFRSVQAKPGESQPVLRRFVVGLAMPALIVAVMVLFVAVLTKLGKFGAWDPPLVAKFVGAIVLIIAVGNLGGWVAVRAGQPRVIGEMATGIMLGPSLLGQFAPAAESWLFPADIVPRLGVVAQVAVVAFVFLFGAELSFGLLRGSGHRVIALGVGMVVFPVACGLLLAVGLAGAYRPTGVPQVSFMLFVGVSMGITAFPVLVRILAHHDLIESRVGALGLMAAGIDDAIAWCLLAVAVATVNDGSVAEAARTVGLLVAFAVLIWTVFRPFLRQFLAFTERHSATRAGSAALLLVFAGCGAFITDRIGVHAIFGAFQVGLALPRRSGVVQDLTRTIEQGVRVVLPLFFAVVGLKVHLGMLSNVQDLLVTGLIVLTAIASKLGGTALIARLTGLPWRESVGLGVMVNCRGLTELVVLTTGLSLGIIGRDLFVMLVLMTLVTTAMTSPLLKRLQLNREPPVESSTDPRALANTTAG